MAYRVTIVNPSPKKGNKKVAKKKTKKKAARKKATKKKAKKRGKKKAAKRTPKRGKKKAAKRKPAKKKAKKRGKKKAKRTTKKKKAAKKKAPKRTAAARKASAAKGRATKAAKKKAAGFAASVKRRSRAVGISRKCKTLVECQQFALMLSDRIETLEYALVAQKKGAALALSALSHARAELKTHQTKIKKLKRALNKAVKDGEVTKAEASAIQKKLDSRSKKITKIRGELKTAGERAAKAERKATAAKKKATKRKPAKKKAAKKKAAKKRKPAKKKAAKKKAAKRTASKRPVRKKKRAPARRKPWPSGVPVPRYDVPEAIDKLSKAGRKVSERKEDLVGRGGRRKKRPPKTTQGQKRAARRLQLSGQGYLQVNPVEEIPGFPGMYRVTSPQTGRTRGVAVGKLPSATRAGKDSPRKKKVKDMSAKAKARIRRAMSRV